MALISKSFFALGLLLASVPFSIDAGLIKDCRYVSDPKGEGCTDSPGVPSESGEGPAYSLNTIPHDLLPQVGRSFDFNPFTRDQLSNLAPITFSDEQESIRRAPELLPVGDLPDGSSVGSRNPIGSGSLPLPPQSPPDPPPTTASSSGGQPPGQPQTPAQSAATVQAAGENRGEQTLIKAAEEAIEECKSSSTSAEEGCMTGKDSDLAPLMNIADQVSRSATVSSIARACTQQSRALEAASAAVLAIKGQCAVLGRSCDSACDQAARAINLVEDLIQRNDLRRELTLARNPCTKAQERIRGMEQQIAHLVTARQKASQCVDDVTDVTQARVGMPTLDQCRANPMLPNCNLVLGEDCLNPQFAASNPVCANCAANPQDPRCQSVASRVGTQPSLGSSGTAGGGGLDNSGSVNPALASKGFAGGFGGAAEGMPLPAAGQGAQRGDLSGGKQAGSGGLSGAGGGAAAPGARGGATGAGGGGFASGINTQVHQGFQSGGVITGATAPRGKLDPSSTYDGWLAGYPADSRFIGANGVDLRQFLPREGVRFGQDNGIRIVGPDGITGPNVSNFEKVRRRYQALAHTLIPYTEPPPGWQIPQYIEAISYGLPPDAIVPPGRIVLPLRMLPGSRVAVSSSEVGGPTVSASARVVNSPKAVMPSARVAATGQSALNREPSQHARKPYKAKFQHQGNGSRIPLTEQRDRAAPKPRKHPSAR